MQHFPWQCCFLERGHRDLLYNHWTRCGSLSRCISLTPVFDAVKGEQLETLPKTFWDLPCSDLQSKYEWTAWPVNSGDLLGKTFLSFRRGWQHFSHCKTKQNKNVVDVADTQWLPVLREASLWAYACSSSLIKCDTHNKLNCGIQCQVHKNRVNTVQLPVENIYFILHRRRFDQTDLSQACLIKTLPVKKINK